MATISIIILNYQTDELTLSLLKGLGKDPRIEVLVVDNSPTNSLERALKESEIKVKYFFSGRNLGFPGGNNFGLAHSTGEWVFFLNSDTKCTARDVLRLGEIAQQEHYLAAAPKIVGANGKRQKNVGFFDSFWRHSINSLFARPRYFTGDSQISVDFAHATALLIKRSVFEKIGTWDEQNYFMYFEDIDLCYRLHRQKIPILFVPEVKIIHLGGESFGGDIAKKNNYYLQSLDKYLLKTRGPVIVALNKVFRLFR